MRTLKRPLGTLPRVGGFRTERVVLYGGGSGLSWSGSTESNQGFGGVDTEHSSTDDVGPVSESPDPSPVSLGHYASRRPHPSVTTRVVPYCFRSSPSPLPVPEVSCGSSPHSGGSSDHRWVHRGRSVVRFARGRPRAQHPSPRGERGDPITPGSVGRTRRPQSRDPSIGRGGRTYASTAGVSSRKVGSRRRGRCLCPSTYCSC